MPEQYGYPDDEYTPFGRALAALKIAKQAFRLAQNEERAKQAFRLAQNERLVAYGQAHPRYDELMPDDPAYGDSPLVAEGQFVPYPYQPMPYYPPYPPISEVQPPYYPPPVYNPPPVSEVQPPYPYQPMPYYPPTAEGVPYVPMPEPPWLSGGSSAIPMPLPPFVPSAEGVPVYPSSEEMVPYDQPQAPYVPWYDDYENEY
jgi:hypothetical protein